MLNLFKNGIQINEVMIPKKAKLFYYMPCVITERICKENFFHLFIINILKYKYIYK